MHYPVRVAKLGRADNIAFDEWRISSSSVDSDVLLIIDDPTVLANQARDAIAQATAQPCAISAVRTLGDADDPAHDAWLVRLPAAGRTDITNWQARGGTLRIGGTHYPDQSGPPWVIYQNG